MPSPLTYRVRTAAADLPVGGYDLCVIVPPDDVWIVVGGRRRGLRVDRLHQVLRRVSLVQAEALREVLHHADWLLTDQADHLRGLHHPGCVRCTAGVDQALAWAAEHPRELFAAGTLYWAQQLT